MPRFQRKGCRKVISIEVGHSLNSDNISNSPSHSAEDAALYDQQVVEHRWYGHEVLFGLMYEFVEPGESLLDIGIGTGLSSILFHKAGLQIFGFDSSKHMLEMCEAKGFAAQLGQHDLQHVPYPYQANSFNHVISLGVLNFFANLAPVVKETARIIKSHGIFGFAVEEQKLGQQAEYLFHIDAGSGQVNEETVVRMYRHSDEHIRSLLDVNGFAVLKDFEFLADRYPEQEIDIYFKAYIAQSA